MPDSRVVIINRDRTVVVEADNDPPIVVGAGGDEAASVGVTRDRSIVVGREVGEPGPPGPPGPQGPAGPQGPTGSGGDLSYVHTQTVASTLWVVAHNLGKFPAVTVVDSGGNVVVGDVSYIDMNTVAIGFTAIFGGKAYCN